MAKANKHGLGRGLGALLGDENDGAISQTAPETPEGERVVRLRITEVDPNRDQPRRSFDEQALRELADSIASVGVIQPIVVERIGQRYRIIAGERRWRASRMAGVSDIPAIVREDDGNRLELALIENLQRDDLNAVDQASAVKSLMEECGYTQEDVAKRLGKSRPAIANLLRILTLDERVVELVRLGKLTAGHAKALAAIEDEEAQTRIANMAVNQGWSVRQLEKVCQQTLMKKPKAVVLPKTQEMLHLERMARDAFGTRAQLEGDSEKGRLILNYYSAEDLQRIWDILEVLGQNS